MNNEAVRLILGKTMAAGWRWRWWVSGSRFIKLQEPNGRDIDNTSFDRFEATDGRAKVTKYHSEQHTIRKREFG